MINISSKYHQENKCLRQEEWKYARIYKKIRSSGILGFHLKCKYTEWRKREEGVGQKIKYFYYETWEGPNVDLLGGIPPSNFPNYNLGVQANNIKLFKVLTSSRLSINNHKLHLNRLFIPVKTRAWWRLSLWTRSRIFTRDWLVAAHTQFSVIMV